MNSKRYSSLRVDLPRATRALRPAAAALVIGGLWFAHLDPALAVAGSAAALAAGWPWTRRELSTMFVVFDRDSGAARCRAANGAPREAHMDTAALGWVGLRIAAPGGRSRRVVLHRALLPPASRRQLRLWGLTLRRKP